MLPRIGSSKLVSTWLLVTVAASLVSVFDGGWLFDWTALAPERIWHGQVWRLVTWIFVEGSPYSLVWTCISIYKFGGELAPRWGDRRLRRFAFHIVLAAGVAASIGALVSEDAWSMYRSGGWAISEALVIAWARQYPTATLRLWGVVELSGRQVIGFVIGVTVLLAIWTSPFMLAPELVACFAAATYPRGWLAKTSKTS